MSKGVTISRAVINCWIKQILNKIQARRKVRGDGYINEDGSSRHVELHWYEADNERVEMKVKRHFDEN